MQRVLIKKIVKLFSVFAFAMMLFSFFACSDLPFGSGGGRNSPAVVVQPDEPYDETIGFGLYSTYAFHNFIGKEPDIIPSTAITDVNRYYDLGVTYIQGKFDAFNQTLVDRSNLQRYFTPVSFTPGSIPSFYNNYPNIKLDRVINQLSTAFELVMTDMVESLRTQEQRDALVLCYRVLANEAYREALGNNRNSINSMTNKYDDEKATILVFWARNQFLSSIDLERDINSSISSNKCRRVIDKLYTLLTYAKNNLRSNNQRILSEITLTDLQNVINLSLLIPSLEAMHDTAAGFLNHQNQNCIMNPRLIETMQQAANGV